MRSWGIWLLVLGVGSFILPFVGLQFKIPGLFGESQSLIASAVALAGAVLLAMAFREEAEQDAQGALKRTP